MEFGSLDYAEFKIRNKSTAANDYVMVTSVDEFVLSFHKLID